MSFRYKNVTVTPSNYVKVFNGYPVDILDEVRSAVLDNTEIGEYIDSCISDSYKLGQLRMCIRGRVPLEFVQRAFSGRTLYLIRQGLASRIDMRPLLKYVNNGALLVESNTVEKLAELLFAGADISKVDFKVLPAELVDVVCSGLLKGYPVWLLIEDNMSMSPGMLNILMRGLSLGIDVHVFLDGHWDESVLILLFSYAKSMDLNLFLTKINSHFDFDSVKELVSYYVKGINIDKLCSKDTDGFPLYDSDQIYEIGRAIELGVVTDEMYNPYYSAKNISDMILEAQKI